MKALQTEQKQNWMNEANERWPTVAQLPLHNILAQDAKIWVIAGDCTWNHISYQSYHTYITEN